MTDIPYGQWFAEQYQQKDLPAEVWALAHVIDRVAIVQSKQGEQIVLIRKHGVTKGYATRQAMAAVSKTKLRLRIQMCFYSPPDNVAALSQPETSDNE